MAKKEKVLITADTVCKGERVKKGATITCEEADARLLESCKKGVRGAAGIEAAKAQMGLSDKGQGKGGEAKA